jgi:hypothetical protein
VEFFNSLSIEKGQVEFDWQNTGREHRFVSRDSNGVSFFNNQTGNLTFIPNNLMVLVNNVGGRSWVWKFRLGKIITS